MTTAKHADRERGERSP